MAANNRTGLDRWGMALAAAREAAGMTVRQLAEATHFSPATISNYEHGHRMPRTKEIKALEDALGTSGRLKALFDEQVDCEISPEWSKWEDIEAHARRLLSYENSYVPGLLQTEVYARAILSHHRHSALDLEQRLERRMARQQILHGENPPTAVFVFSECVFHHEVGSREVMYEQITHLIEMAKRPNVIIQVVPEDAGFHVGLSGAFMITKMPGGTEVAYQDGIWMGQVLKDDPAVSTIGDYWQYIQSKALTEEATLTLLRKEAEKWKA